MVVYVDLYPITLEKLFVTAADKTNFWVIQHFVTFFHLLHFSAQKHEQSKSHLIEAVVLRVLNICSYLSIKTY